jgi:penicillin amidase
VKKSLPQTNGTIHLTSLHQAVDVYRDEFGIPHIIAGDEHDLMVATGYVQAQDRLWQMDISRRAGEGRLSEIFDTSTVQFDKLFRTLRFSALADSLAEHLHPETKQILQDYADGVNAFIDSHHGSYPIEFDMLQYQPEHWKVEHSLLLSRLMAWELNFAWWVDLTYAEIAAKVPPEKLKEIYPTYPDSIPPIVSQTPVHNLPMEKMPKASAELSFQGATPDPRYTRGLHQILSVARSYREWFNMGSLSGGSNAWVIAGSRSISGRPILANDPHLRFSAPARWYEMHLSAPGLNVEGVTIPGSPVVVIGHNDSLAWGLTNAMLDDADFYFEQFDSSEHNYRFQESMIPIDRREETIYVGTHDSISIVTRFTRHGPIISDVHPVTQRPGNDSTLTNTPIAMRWTGYEISDEMYGFFRMDKATNHDEFESAIREIAVPGQSLVYADARGNIGYWMTGRVPIRPKSDPILPQKGWDGSAEWQGYVPFDQLPHLWNPSSGAIICANQKIADNSFPYILSNYWEPPARLQRISELLSSMEKYSESDFRRIQMDVVSPYARAVTGRILNAYADSGAENESVRNALEYLRNWDFRATTGDVAGTIVNVFLVKLFHNIYEDEMGPEVFSDFVFFSAIPYRVTDNLMARDSSAWFENVQTGVRESKRDIIHKSLLDALEELNTRFGSEMKSWQWGNIHQIVFAHPFGRRKPLDRIFNVGPFPMNGSTTTISKAEFQIGDPYDVYSGPSFRMVVDLSKPQLASTVIPLGQSGQPFDDHYDDQVALWRNGVYHPVTLNIDEIRRMRLEHLILKP